MSYCDIAFCSRVILSSLLNVMPSKPSSKKTQTKLAAMTVAQLKKECERLGIAQKGKKEDLVNRLLPLIDKEDREKAKAERTHEQEQDADDEDEEREGPRQGKEGPKGSSRVKFSVGDLDIMEDIPEEDVARIDEWSKEVGQEKKEDCLEWFDLLAKSSRENAVAALSFTGINPKSVLKLLEKIGFQTKNKPRTSQAEQDQKARTIGENIDGSRFHFMDKGSDDEEQYSDDDEQQQPHHQQSDIGERDDASSVRAGAGTPVTEHGDAAEDHDKLYFDGSEFKCTDGQSDLVLDREFTPDPNIFNHEPHIRMSRRFKDAKAAVLALFPKSDPISRRVYKRSEIKGRVRVLYIAQKKLERLVFEDLTRFRRHELNYIENPLSDALWKKLSVLDKASKTPSYSRGQFSSSGSGFGRNRGPKCYRCGLIGHVAGDCRVNNRKTKMHDQTGRRSVRASGSAGLQVSQ